MSWLQSIEVRGALVAFAVFVLSGGVLAQDASKDMRGRGMSGGCEDFKWPLAKERAAFDDASLEKVVSGGARGPLKEQAFELALIPAVDVAYSLAPAIKKKDAGAAQFGGILRFAAPEKPGVYQVTLSGEGWIDLVQNGIALQSADHSGAKNCPGLRKSVRFNVGAAPLALQISGAQADTIKVAIRQVE